MFNWLWDGVWNFTGRPGTRVDKGCCKDREEKGRVAQEEMDAPMRGWAISPLMGPASHTNDVSCSDTPKLNKKGVPYL